MNIYRVYHDKMKQYIQEYKKKKLTEKRDNL